MTNLIWIKSDIKSKKTSNFQSMNWKKMKWFTEDFFQMNSASSSAIWTRFIPLDFHLTLGFEWLIELHTTFYSNPFGYYVAGFQSP